MTTIKRFDIYWVNLDPSIGGEIAKTRPCVVISSDEENRRSSTVIIAPMTTNKSPRNQHAIPYQLDGRDSFILLDQLRTVDKSRLFKKMGQVEDFTQRQIFQTLNVQLTIEELTILFELAKPIALEEDRTCEFKEVTAKNPVDSIKNTADKYAVAFLNSEGGRILWGIRDKDRVVVGVKATLQERDEIRREVSNKLGGIQPPVDVSSLRVIFHTVYDAGKAVPDLFVIELAAPQGEPSRLYFTQGNEAFVRVDGANRQLQGPAIQEWVMKRLGLKAS